MRTASSNNPGQTRCLQPFCALPTFRHAPSRRHKAFSCATHAIKWQQAKRSRVPAAAPRIVCSASGLGVFPAGKAQAKVQIPALVLRVSTEGVIVNSDCLQTISSAVASGATAVLLEDVSGSGANLYQAALSVKDALRGRASFWLLDRTDIAVAAEADGVILSSQGVPVAVARRTFGGTDKLVGALCTSPEEASAAAAQGASLILLQGNDEEVPEPAAAKQAQAAQKSGSSIPLLLACRSAAGVERHTLTSCDGLALPVAALPDVAARCSGDAVDGVAAAAEAVSKLLRGELAMPATSFDPGAAKSHLMRRLLAYDHERILDVERSMLTDVLQLLTEVTPEIQEVDLLRDALKQLDELFLVVVVGEFNSGKSSVINALLGAKFLAEGILPTTNEISVLKHSTSGKEEVTRDDDGVYTRYLQSDLLRELNIVDTPGTNVVLERQQRLTEEYVPRADMVLFVMSSDRPFTDSEVKFLRYIRKWGKKVVFVLNKVDILEDGAQVDEVVGFVRDNAKQLLGVEQAQVIPVAARQALAAKLKCGSELTGGVLSSMDESMLESMPAWKESRFGQLEEYILRFLLGDSETSAGESVRLKLQTPLYVASALLEAAAQKLQGDLNTAQAELEAVQLVSSQLRSFRRAMQQDSEVQRTQCRVQVQDMLDLVDQFVDEKLNITNFAPLVLALINSKGEGGKHLGAVKELRSGRVASVIEAANNIAVEHRTWLQDNCRRQTDNYNAFARQKAEQLGSSLEQLLNGSTPQVAVDVHEGEAVQSTPSSSGNDTASTALTTPRFDVNELGVTLEKDLRDAVLSTAGATAGSGVVGFVLTALLQSGLEDLMAVLLAGAAAYISVLNLPLRRADVKRRVREFGNVYCDRVDAALQADLQSELQGCEAAVMQNIRPLETLAIAEVERIRNAEQRRVALADRLQELRQQIAFVE